VKAWIFANPILTLAIAVVLFYFAITFGGGVLAGLRHAFQNRTIDKLEKKADASQGKTQSLVNQADQQKLDRHDEDLNRERTIKPQIETASRSVATARSRTDAARRDYEKARNTRFDRNSNSRALHVRNCTDLRELYPGEDLKFCSP
jgi:hypothetical protein